MTKKIAEIANAHEGSVNRAINIAKLAGAAGADAVKFQIYFGDDLLTSNHPRYEHFCNQSFSKKEWRHIISESKKYNKEIIADVFGKKALETAMSNKVDGIKIHSSDLSNTPLIEECAKTNLPIYLATGGSTIIEIKDAVKTIKNTNFKNEINLMHGYQAYPTQIKNNDLNRILELKRIFGDMVTYGFMDHTDASYEHSIYLPATAIALGCSVIEKHITDDRSLKGVDYYSSLERNEFKKFVSFCNNVDRYLGKQSFERSKDEEVYRSTVKKVFVASKEIKKGTVINKDNVEMLRSPEVGISKYDIINNKLAIRNIKKGDLILSDAFDRKVLAIVVARSKSTRLKGKASLNIGSVTSLEHLFKRLELSKNKKYINEYVLCTSNDSSDDDLAQFAESIGLTVFRGDEENVLKRMMLAVSNYPEYSTILRVTGDDILIEPNYLKKTIQYHFKVNADYTDAKLLPSGTEVEVFESSVLSFLSKWCVDTSGTEYLTNYITENSHLFECASLPVDDNETIDARLTLDTKEDYFVINELINYFITLNKEFTYTLKDIVNYFKENPEKININKDIVQKKIPKKFSTEIDYDALCSDLNKQID
jgi:N,N'-diacetyllegionaminate synthase